MERASRRAPLAVRFAQLDHRFAESDLGVLHAAGDMHRAEGLREELHHSLRAGRAESRRHRAIAGGTRTSFETRGQEPLDPALVDDAGLAIAVRLKIGRAHV